MSSYIAGNAYEMVVRREAQRNMPWVRLAEVVTEVTRTNRGYQAVIPCLKDANDTDTTDLGLDGEASTLINVDSRDVVIPLAIYGKKYQKFDATASLRETVPNRSLLDRITRQARLAANSLDAAAYNAVAAIPINGAVTAGQGAPANYTHTLGPNGTDPNYYFKPVDDGLIHIGISATSEASCDSINKTITGAALNMMVQKLVNANVPPIGYLDAGDANSFLYAAILTDQQMVDLRNETGDGSIGATNRFVSSTNRVYAGTWKIWNNLLLITSPRAKQIHTIPGTTPVQYYVHRAVIFGAGYLACASTPVDDLPASGEVERIGVFEELDSNPGIQDAPGSLARLFEVRRVPAYDPQGKMSLLSWYAHLGFKILQPTHGIQLITRASNDPAIQ